MRSLPEPTAENAPKQLHALNCFLFAAILIWSVTQQPVSWSQFASSSDSAEINLALHYSPRTPPPIFEPEILDLAQDSTDPYSASMPI